MVAAERELPAVVGGVSPSADAIPLALRRRGRGSPRQVLAVVLLGTLLLAVFASRELSAWLDRMGDGPALAPLQSAAAEWHGAMRRLGLTRPSAALHAAMRRVLDLEW
jgi:hypothetical protein